jgi:tRNA A37 threonylcarbamoyladenosine synthetase subunit TsaC/SUA5/YrdC
MTQITMQEKLERAAGVICKQGMVQFPLSDTVIAIVVSVVGDNEEELDLIYAFREKSSQTTDQLVESSGFSMEKVERLATWFTGFCRSCWWG